LYLLKYSVGVLNGEKDGTLVIFSAAATHAQNRFLSIHI